MTEHDISDEVYREYVLADRSHYRIENPVTLWVKQKPEGDSHRVKDAEGMVHYIPAGWVILRWYPKAHASVF